MLEEWRSSLSVQMALRHYYSHKDGVMWGAMEQCRVMDRGKAITEYSYSGSEDLF